MASFRDVLLGTNRVANKSQQLPQNNKSNITLKLSQRNKPQKLSQRKPQRLPQANKTNTAQNVPQTNKTNTAQQLPEPNPKVIVDKVSGAPLLAYVYPGAKFVSKSHGPEKLILVCTVCNYFEKEIKVVVKVIGSNEEFESTIYIRDAGLYLNENNGEWVFDELYPLSEPNCFLSKIANRLFGIEFYRVLTYRKTIRIGRSKDLTLDNFSSKIKKLSSVYGYYNADDQKQWTEEFIAVKNKNWYCECRCSSRFDFPIKQKTHCCNQSELMRLTIDAIIHTDCILLDDGSIALCYMPNNYPHIFHIQIGSVTIYGGEEFTNVENMRCAGTSTHPATMLIVMAVLMKKYKSVNPLLESILMSDYFPRLNADLLKYQFISNTYPTIQLLIDNFTFGKCIVGHDNCRITCLDAGNFCIHLVYIMMLKIGPVKGNDWSIEYRGQNFRAILGEEFDTIISPKISETDLILIKKHLVDMLTRVSNIEHIAQFLSGMFAKFDIDIELLSTEQSDIDVSKIDAESLPTDSYCNFLYELKNYLHLPIHSEYMYHKLSVDFTCWPRRSAKSFFLHFYPNTEFEG